MASGTVRASAMVGALLATAAFLFVPSAAFADDPVPNPSGSPSAAPVPAPPPAAPQPVQDLRWQALSATTVRLSWAAPSDVVAGTLYTAEARVAGSKRVLRVRTASTTAIFSGVQPGTSLVPQVQDDARRAAGFADTGPTWTQPLAPASAPRSVRMALILPAGVPGLHVSWTPPASDGGSRVTGYRISVTRSGAQVSSAERAVGAGTRSTTFVDVDPGTAYLATVVAVTRVGDGQPAGSSIVDTGSSPSPSAVGDDSGVVPAGAAPAGDVAPVHPSAGAQPQVAAPRVQVAAPRVQDVAAPVMAAVAVPVLALLGSVFAILLAGALAIVLVVRRFGI